MPRAYIDLESFSTTDIRKTGAHKYAECDSTLIMCFAVLLDNGEPILWKEDDPLPPELIQWAADPAVTFVAHNAPFEIAMFNGTPGKKIGFPFIPVDRWICTAVKARVHALPGSLEQACKKAGVKVGKDMGGHAVMMKLARKRKPSQSNSNIRWTPETKPEDFQKLYEYCESDILATRALDYKLNDITKPEQKLWELDCAINDRGIQVDIAAVKRIINVREVYKEDLEAECVKICGTRSSGRDRVMKWAAEQNFPLLEYTKGYLAQVLENQGPPEDVRRVLEIRLQSGKISTKKYDALDLATSLDYRLRGTLMFHGAQTGRWAGKIFQPHNMARGSLSDPSQAIDDLMSLDYEAVKLLYGDIMEMISSCIRGMVIAADGKELTVTDYAAIEARVIQWLAGDMEACAVFAAGKDMYKEMATAIFGCTYEEVTKEQRFVGKTAVLGLGYQMGWRRFLEQCHDFGATYVDELLAITAVNTFRNKFYRIKRLWRRIENVAKDAIDHQGEWLSVNKHIRFGYNGVWLIMQLPSGRYIYYLNPAVENRKFTSHDGTEYWREVLEYSGIDTKTRQFTRTSTFGGRLVENAVQAIARDIMCDAITRLEASGYPVVLHVHDEIVCETPIGTLPAAEMERIMCVRPEWGADIPIGAEGFTAQRYKK